MRTLVGAALAAALLCGTALAADGIDIMRGDKPNSCTATASKEFSLESGGLSVGVQQKLYVLVFMTGLAAEKIPTGDYPATLAFDAQPPFSLNVHGDDGVFIAVLSGSQWLALRSVHSVTLHVRNIDYVFSAERLAEVMDGAAKCAGVPTVLEVRQARERIVKALANKGWLVGSKDSQSSCHGTRIGLDVDSFITQYADGRFTFGVADPSWSLDPSTTDDATLVIDQDAPRSVKVVKSHQTANVVADADLLQRLETAKVVVWHLPWGIFRSEVDGFPNGRKKLADCLAQ